MVKEVTSSELKQIIASSDKPVVVDVWASWCGPCSYFSPIIDSIAADNKDSILVLKLNFDENQEYATTELMVMNIPSVYVFVGGRVVKRIVGAHDKDKMSSYLSSFID